MSESSVPEPGGLSQTLRTATRSAHVEAERAFDLESRLVDRDEYRSLLLALQRFHAGAESRLRSVGGWGGLQPAVDLSARQRTSMLVRDLDELGVTAPSAEASRLPELDGLPAALGCLYVLEGSLLGGRVIARRARARLGDVPVAFFSGSGRRVGADWRSLQLALDTFGWAQGAPACATAVSVARETFAAFTGCLSRGAQPA